MYDINFYRYGSAHPGINRQKYQLENFLQNTPNIVSIDSLPLMAQMLSNNYINKMLRVLKINNFKIGQWNYVLQNRSRENVTLPKKFTNIYLDGYWQNLSWIRSYKDQIRRQISVKGISEKAKEMVHDEIESNSVAVHVRRTDLLSDNSDIQEGFYYCNAINYIEQNVKNPRYYIFSDDINWCLKNLFKDIQIDSNRIIFSNNKSAEDDFICMMNSKHNIIANSTFSWWAAWLNKNDNQIVISPNFGKRKDILPKEWIVL